MTYQLLCSVLCARWKTLEGCALHCYPAESTWQNRPQMTGWPMPGSVRSPISDARGSPFLQARSSRGCARGTCPSEGKTGSFCRDVSLQLRTAAGDSKPTCVCRKRAEGQSRTGCAGGATARGRRAKTPCFGGNAEDTGGPRRTSRECPREGGKASTPPGGQGQLRSAPGPELKSQEMGGS